MFAQCATMSLELVAALLLSICNFSALIRSDQVARELMLYLDAQRVAVAFFEVMSKRVALVEHVVELS